jgi:HAD superfamily hydrolase (TIGR01509 family)
VIEAVVFDLDGVLIDSEQVWDEVRQRYVEDQHGRWKPEATRTMMGMSSTEWSTYLHDELDVPKDPATISTEVADLVQDRYRAHLPLLTGAVETVVALARRWPLGLASSSNRSIIDVVLDTAGLTERFAVVLSAEEVGRGKPAPDVYLEAARRLGVDPARSIGVEDSSNGLRAAHAAGMKVVAIPNPHFPPDEDALALAAVHLDSVAELDVDVIERLGDYER